jgi:hypothetical protein
MNPAVFVGGGYGTAPIANPVFEFKKNISPTCVETIFQFSPVSVVLNKI